MKIAYFDCFSGASGDMLLASLLSAGADLAALQEDLDKLGLQEYQLEMSPAGQHGISGTQFRVLDAGGERPARNLQVIKEIILKSTLGELVKDRSLAIFRRLAEAEAQVHGTTLDKVHFHEVGAVDSLVDIVGFCAVMEQMGIETIYASPLPVGWGQTRTEHGLLPLPVPATLSLLASAKAPLVPRDIQAELVTPTGAAILSTLAKFERPAMTVASVGYGFGSRTLPWPNMLRVWIGEKLEVQAETSGHHHGEKGASQHSHVHTHQHHDHDHDHGHEHKHDHDQQH